MRSREHKEAGGPRPGGGGHGGHRAGLRVQPGRGLQQQRAGRQVVLQPAQPGLPVDPAAAPAGHRHTEGEGG